MGRRGGVSIANDLPTYHCPCTYITSEVLTPEQLPAVGVHAAEAVDPLLGKTEVEGLGLQGVDRERDRYEIKRCRDLH